MNTRKNIHKNYQIHRGVHVFVSNSNKELLIQKRSEKKDYYPGFFDASVGAQVLATESYKNAALRETQEELGFKPKSLTKICDYKSYSSRQKENRRLFVCQSNGPFKIDKEEVEFVKFYPIEGVREEINKGEKQFTEGFKISFENFLRNLKAGCAG
ncbi:NUDIX domain-containing protein [Patescibacteria group bacterium]